MALHATGGFDPGLGLMVDFLDRVGVPLLPLNAGRLVDQLVQRMDGESIERRLFLMHGDRRAGSFPIDNDPTGTVKRKRTQVIESKRKSQT